VALWFRYLSRISLELHQSQCNGHNFPLIGKLAYTFTSSFRSMYQGRTHILGRGVLGLVGLWQPLVPLFVQNFSLELHQSQWANSNFCLHHTLQVCTGKNI
jgi:hypothetical protein